jgi:acyl-CoA synthetase (NDP forming)
MNVISRLMRPQRVAVIGASADIASLPAVPDVGIVLLGAERAHHAVRELAQRGCAAAIVLASGYGEVGEEGKRRQAELRDAAGTMRILGPNTIGLVNITDGIVLFASGALEMDHFPSGAVSVVSQSGTFRVWPNFLLDEFPDVVFGLLQIEGTLQIEPELRRRIEVAGKP